MWYMVDLLPKLRAMSIEEVTKAAAQASQIACGKPASFDWQQRAVCGSGNECRNDGSAGLRPDGDSPVCDSGRTGGTLRAAVRGVAAARSLDACAALSQYLY